MSKRAIITLIFFIILICSEVRSQSVSINCGYPYYFMQLKSYGDYIDVRNDFNYVAGFSIGNYFNSSKIELGISVGTKNYSFNFSDIHRYQKKIISEINYYIIPLTFNQRIFSDSINTVSLSLGIAFIRPYRYSKETISNDDLSVKKDNIPVMYEFGNNARFGVKYSRRIYKQFFLFSELYSDYKFNSDYSSSGSSSNYFDLTDDRFSAGINLGIEWIFNNRELDYYKKK